MRRKDKELKDVKDIEAVIDEALVCRIGLCINDRPYIVPMCFGYAAGALYLHSAKEGRKIDILKNNRNVCFEIDMGAEVIPSGRPCSFGMRHRSVIGSGKAVFVDRAEEKRSALNSIMQKYSGRAYEYSDQDLEKVAVIKIEIEELSVKESGRSVR